VTYKFTSTSHKIVYAHFSRCVHEKNNVPLFIAPRAACSRIV